MLARAWVFFWIAVVAAGSFVIMHRLSGRL
jgi:hypothetical protein